jgi:UDP-N-acetylmuramoyl-tripeptide--D-alanyl-D-alanine ligase
MFFPFLIILWFAAVSKNILFWLYFWQLKEYHIGRFLAHFQTEKGRKLLFNKLLSLKIFFVFVFLLFFLFGWRFWDKDSLLLGRIIALILAAGVFVVYFLEALRIIQNLFRKKLKAPVFTAKAIVLISIGLIIELAFILILFPKLEDYPFFILGLLLFDVFLPLIVSTLVLLFQPLAVLRKKQIIGRAIKKREGFKNLLVIGITGSYGKTSTKEFLAAILSQKFNVLKTKEHQNSEMGISQCILDELKPEHGIFVVEMGAYNKGGIKLLCQIAQPKIGILTGINEQHLATFGSQKNIISAKFELIESLPEDGAAILNFDSRYMKAKIQGPDYKVKVKNQKLYSTQEKLDIWAENILIDKDSVSFRACLKTGESFDFRSNVLGKHNVINILGAIITAKELGMSLEEIRQGVQRISNQEGGMVLKKSPFGANIIDSSYSANPDGVISDLDYLKVWSGKKAIIMPCLIELGSSSKSIHKRIGEKIAEVCQLAIITTKDNFKEVKEGAIGKGMKPENILFLEKPKEILEKVKDFNQENDVMLLEGRISKEILGKLI